MEKKEAVDLKYSSTRGNGVKLDSAQAIIQGLAADGGLFVPDSMPKVDAAFIASLGELSYEERAAKVLGLFLTDYTADEIAGCVARAYGNHKFDAAMRAPVRIFDDLGVLELWHGPTSAFKDMALQLLPQLMSTALKKTGEQDKVLILVATSGDTGKAALEGFCDVDQIKIMVFYPEGGVSRIQQLQMLTQEGANVNVTAVRGNFDDAQSGVKSIFSDKAFNEELGKKGVKLSSANSINWGRLVPQIVYYFSAYADLVKAGKIEAGDEINFTVPTGNFGDILAGFYAKCMGLPVHKLICASNANNVLTDFLRTGVYDRNRDFYKTITPSMDILISSNLERLLYHMTGDTARVAGWMQELSATGRYDIGAELLQKIQQTFWADWTSDADTKELIGRVYKDKHYVPDTHTAVAWKVAENYQQATGDDRYMVIASTASPYKFNGSVLEALGVDTAGLDEFAMLDRLQELNDDPTPQGLASLRTKAQRHDDVCACEGMRQAVLAFAEA
ncbi:threonine synthase [Selenomonas ruminantium]|uniref:Threonine synthase n=1 Tax=Selenomonas ruminantium TaxID=971 RepID=A0A1I3D7V5_SELRU|nr:threonine synthase [Selenomonas ruminantium]SFH82820.1 threonine synthase [Selenomonas ruminantium]